MPAHSLTGGPATACRKVDSTMAYSPPSFPGYYVTRDSGYQPINWAYQPYPYIAVYVNSNEYNHGAAPTFWGDHNIEANNGVRVGFRIHGTNYTSPNHQYTYVLNGVSHTCTWLGSVSTDPNTGNIISVTYIIGST